MAANPAVSLTVVVGLANCSMPGDSATAILTQAWLFAGDRSNSSPVTLAVQVAGPATIGCKMMVRVVLTPTASEPSWASNAPAWTWTVGDLGTPATETT